jgi:tRNA modification GTPase
MHLMINDTIYAPATPPGVSALAIVRISGNDAINICNKIFKPYSKKTRIADSPTQSAHFGSIFYGEGILDEVVVTIFRSPRSYTGENLVEISCHGSMYIVNKLCELLSSQGLRIANPGEFTLRAFLNGKFDLSQAEAVADLIHSNAQASHGLALNQMRGGYSKLISALRSQLLEFASLLTLELDFSEEDVEFVNRDELRSLLQKINNKIDELVGSFKLGNVLKSGIPIAIVGKPNVGKSTLLNAILNEEKAIVSDIPGTTRDAIEDTVIIDGIAFRFIDTAGLRVAGDTLEQIGMLRTIEKIAQANIVLYVVDISQTTVDEINSTLKELGESNSTDIKTFIVVANKTDLLIEAPTHFSELMEHEVVFVSAKRKENINLIMESLLKSVNADSISDKAIVSNVRHYEALTRTREALNNVQSSMKSGVSADLLSIDINVALHNLGLITGEITTDEILGNIFSKFCIGK